MADIEITQAIKDHIEKYDTPKADDPRRRYTVAQLETAIQAAIAQQIEKDAGIAERPIMYDYVRIDEAEEWHPGSPYDRGRKEEAERIAAAIRAQKP